MAAHRCVVLVVVGATAAIAPGAAVADRLVWDAPTGCPAPAELRARVERRVGVALDDVVVPDVSIAVARERGRFVATITSDDDDPRVITAANCDELADAVAVIVARVAEARRPHTWMIDPAPALEALAVATLAPSQTPPVSVPAAAPEPTAPPPPPATAPPGHAPWNWQLGAHVSTFGGVGTLPGLAVGGEVGAFAHTRHLLVELGAAHWVDESAVANHGTADQTGIGLTVATARVGWRLDALPLRAWLVGEAGPMTGVSSGFTMQTSSTLWRAVGAGVGATWPVTRAVAVEVAAEALTPEGHVDFPYAGGTSLYESRAVSARASVGVELGW